MKSEVLISDKGIKLARVLLRFDIPLHRYPDFGTWCYLLGAGKDVVVFDTGPKYSGLLPFFRKKRKETGNTEHVLAALERYFPGKPVREILLSHYHFDHSEAAPELQVKLAEKFGVFPPIRLHAADSGKKKLMRVIDEDIHGIFEATGISYKLGKPLKDKEKIKGTEFYLKHMPGHTHGTCGLVSDKYKTIICGWWGEKHNSLFAKLSLKLLNEGPHDETIAFLQKKGYHKYYFHPLLISKPI